RSQVGRDEAERITQPLAIAHENRAALDGYRQPLVGIQGERIRARETDIAWRQVGVERADRAVRCVDMEPEPVLAHTSAIASSGSIAPVPTVPALAPTQNGRGPAARSAATARRSAPTSMRAS